MTEPVVDVMMRVMWFNEASIDGRSMTVLKDKISKRPVPFDLWAMKYCFRVAKTPRKCCLDYNSRSFWGPG